MKYIKKFENTYIKKTLVDLDIIEIENMVIDKIDKGIINITDYFETDNLSIKKIHQLNPYYANRIFSFSMVYQLFYPNEIGSKYNTKNFKFIDISGLPAKVVKVELIESIGNRHNLDITGYTRDIMKSIFKKVESIYDVSSYISIIYTNTYGPLVSESIIIFQ